MIDRKYMLAMIVGVVLGAAIGLCSSVLADKESSVSSVPFDELRAFSEVFGRIQKDYVEQVPDKKLIEDAIRGMLSGLDPHSSYLNSEQYEELRVGTTGRFGGLGIEVGMENGFVKVIAPIDDTPASNAGVKAGDLIIRLDEKPVKGLTLGEAVKMMRGEPGTDIELTIVREGENKPINLTITRDIIKIRSVKFKLLDAGYGYLRVSSFQSSTGKQLRNAVKTMIEENGGPLNGVVLDLRNNPGGVLNAAVEVSDAFLKDGLIVFTGGRIKNSEMKFKATPDDILNNKPIVVLINAGSASASEIVAGALQDHGRAIIMGEKSFGKGSVQTILPTSNGGAIKLTTARYYTPSGRSIQAEGIEPDIPLSRYRLEALERSPLDPVTEAKLSHHLENGKKSKSDSGKKEDGKDDEGKDEQLEALMQDYALTEALNLLKGINIMQSHQVGKSK
ncbi:MAG: S41 family peptidase [Gammaproteobacteria bacterium]|nr:S41 family peptidase [Gammaproteobacteria bacterium]